MFAGISIAPDSTIARTCALAVDGGVIAKGASFMVCAVFVRQDLVAVRAGVVER